MLTAQESQGGLTIDWAAMPTYNTIMSVAVGAGLVGLVLLGRDLRRDPGSVSHEGWALSFGVLGGLLVTTGLHMTLTWPLASGGFAFDNIIFGETSLAFGALLLAASVYLWRRAGAALAEPDPVPALARVALPMTPFVFLLGLSLLAIAAAGVQFQLFVAPPQEPITGFFAAYPWLEILFISGLIALVGVGALAFPFLVRSAARGERTSGFAGAVVGWTWLGTGLAFGVFGALNYFTHIGLIVNTM